MRYALNYESARRATRPNQKTRYHLVDGTQTLCGQYMYLGRWQFHADPPAGARYGLCQRCERKQATQVAE